MPFGALMTAGALVLAGNTPAGAAQAAAAAATTSTSSLNEAPVAGQVAATVKVSDTERSRQKRKATIKATAKLTSKVKVTSKASATVSRTSRKSRTVSVTRYAPTHAAAVAEAKKIAKKAAHDRAAAAAKADAAKRAMARAKSLARKKAKAKANKAVRTKFGKAVVRRAAAQKGKPYRYGATGPRAFDCSGLVKYVMTGVGVKVPRTSSAIAKKAHRVAKGHKQLGDLIFFTSGGSVYHVAVYAGDNRVWHAPYPGQRVKKEKIWTSSYQVGRLPA
jgi:cell wall-associated NlpC family hydrolase